MGEDSSVNDGSWKHLVRVKKENMQWISRQSEGDTPANIGNTLQRSSFEDYCDSNIYNEVVVKNETSDSDSMVSGISHDAEPIFDPINIEDTPKTRKRRGQSPRNETPDERSARLAKMSAYAAQRLANETSDQRAARLKRMSEYAAKRLAQETSEQRAKRLARMSAYAARRLAEEAPEQRAARLARMSAYAAKRQAMKKFLNSTLMLPNNAIDDSASSEFMPSNSMNDQS